MKTDPLDCLSKVTFFRNTEFGVADFFRFVFGLREGRKLGLSLYQVTDYGKQRELVSIF